MHALLEFVTHLDDKLGIFVNEHGPWWVYGLLFLIVFAETGLVITPFLPGDSLLFAAGAVAATSSGLNVWVVWALLVVAAIIGDAVNYAVGHYIGPRIFKAEDRDSFWHRRLNRNHLLKAHKFYEKHGGKAIVLGRFAPIIRTFVPFVAGCGSMSYPQFALFNVLGGLLWVSLCVGAGYFFGTRTWVKENFEYILIAIVVISLLPILWGYIASRAMRETDDETPKA